MANELLTRDDIVRGKKNFDAQNAYMTGTAEEQVTLPDGQKIKTRAGFEKELREVFPPDAAGMKFLGYTKGKVPLAEDTFKAANISVDNEYISSNSSDFSCNDFEVGSRYLIDSGVTNAPPPATGNEYFLVETRSITRNSRAFFQVAWGSVNGAVFVRSFNSASQTWSKWSSVSSSKLIYNTTTATSANTVVTSTGELQRSTSSKIFKHDIADIDISNYREALKAVRPVSYRSTDATSDRTDWSWYSFIAEELAAIDPRLVQMDNIEFFEDTKEDGTPFINSRELPEGEYAANGINTNGIVALMVHINQQMLGDIEKLEDEKTQLKRRMTNLEKRMDAIDGPAAPAE